MTILWPNGLTTPPPFSWQGHFGKRDAGLGYASRYHRGQDFYGFTNVHSIADGTVVLAGTAGGWYGGGTMVWVQHDGFFTRSLHLASINVHVGQHVDAGDIIGTMGNTPHRTPPMAVHLHLEVTLGQWHYSNTGQIDPRAFLDERVGHTTGGGGIVADIGGNMEAYLLHENGDVVYVRPGLKKKFTSVDDYNAWRETVNGLRRKKQTSMMRVPYITGLKKLSGWRFDAIVDGVV